MSTSTAEGLTKKKCVPCEGGVPTLSKQEVDRLLEALPGWHTTREGQRIRREWKAKNFVAAIDFFNKIAALAEEEGHHPDLHLVGYRNVAVEIWTHAIGGLSENDFIVAAKIDRVPIAEVPTPGVEYRAPRDRRTHKGGSAGQGLLPLGTALRKPSRSPISRFA